jgi:2-(1,2-epoxy-1,2-dihydrophenyl)acetyl-CoA isomerase
VSQPVLYDVSDSVATITFNRPEALNAASLALKSAFMEALEEAGRDDGVRAVVLTGAGRAFCVGQDLREHADRLAARDASLGSTVRDYNRIVLGLATLPKPVIAAVNGVAAGAGASFAFAADFRLAADDASFLMAFARVGLGVDSGGSWTLQRLVGYARATALLMLAEPVSATSALEMGLVNGVVPAADLPAAAKELGMRLAAGPTTVYGVIKEALRYAAVSSLPEALEREAQLQAVAGATEDHRNATAAFLAKQAPVFTGH